MKLIFKYIFKYKKFILLKILSIFLVAGGEIIIPFYIGKRLFDRKSSYDTTLFPLVWWLLLIVILAICGNLIINFCTAKLSSLVFRDLSIDIFKKVQTLSIIDMQTLGVSNVMNQTTFSVHQIINFMTTFYRAVIISPIMLIISLSLMYYISPTLSYNIFILVPFFVLILFFVMRKNYLLSLAQHQQLEKMNNKIRENVIGTKVIRSLNQIQFEKKQFDDINFHYRNLIVKLFLSVLSIEPFFYFLLNTSILFTIGFSVHLMMTKEFLLDLSKLYNFINLQYHLLFSILNFLLLFTMFPKTLVFMDKIEKLLQKKPSLQNHPMSKRPLLGKINNLAFKNVSFTYNSPKTPIIQNINFQVRSGEVVALVGSTGAGKTTFINLIPRLIDPTQGVIEMNGIDIKNYDLFLLRDKISFVSQKNILFKGTIFSNLLFGDKNAKETQMWEKARLSQSYDFIQNKNNQLQEPVSELGANLSGGQKQRLSITRAFLKEPDIYIFDDSFSALDYQTDFAIRKSFFEFKKDVIVFIVAQRITSILNADQIIVLDQGKIVAKGRHQQLLESCEIYQKIVAAQQVSKEL
ncbi:ABC transporter ATP-binding protein [Candidatus Phytoplasma phoenicium]|uniref:Multidrug resistance ABC transporter ATP-binding and permease protein n=1 Tax=Candidatus Phytoplasma phoenicium TaxID=198422 RepID=A0A0L0MJZ0_9MOLU|nr:ABC transporter ATP-binding protein [Candidatus Phytoplasma phoenicium]KND62605.1 multidrug resistance ABC transporter ATP-binding and permease protein [Candidatus Phytoplasma phoenicium]